MKTHILSLSRDLLDDQYAVRLKTDGYSMYPLLRPGDTIYIERISFQALPIGSIVVFKRGERWVAHRLIRKDHWAGHSMGYTQGDSCIKLDEAVTEANYIGRVMARKRGNQPAMPLQPGAYGRFMVHNRPWPHYPLHFLVKAVRKWRRLVRIVDQRFFG